jgi:hypothetical protein
MDDRVTLAIRFPGLEVGEAGRAAQQLRNAILDDVPGMKVDIEKDDPTNQDFGATLIAVLGTQAAIMLARGIATWIKQRGTSVEVTIDGEKTTFQAHGTIDDNAVKIVNALSRHKK